MIAFRSVTVGPGTPSELKLLLFPLRFHLNVWLCIHKLRNVWGGFSQSLIDELTRPQLGCQPASWGYSCLLRSLFFFKVHWWHGAIPEWDLYWLWSLPLPAGGALGTAGESSEGRVNDEALEEETAQCKILPTFSSFLHPNQLLR